MINVVNPSTSANFSSPWWSINRATRSLASKKIILTKELEIIYPKQCLTLSASDYEAIHILFFAVIYIRTESKKIIHPKIIFTVNSQSTTLSKTLNYQSKKESPKPLIYCYSDPKYYGQDYWCKKHHSSTPGKCTFDTK